MPVEQTPPENYTRTCILWDGGWMEFDAVLREQIEHDGEVTEHPVDAGADIADHYRRFNIPLVLETEITNTPIRQPLTHTDGSSATQLRQDVEIPAPLSFGPFTAPSTVFGFDARARHTVTLSSLSFEPGMDRISAVYAELDAMQLEPRLLTVALGRFRTFDNMLLKSFTVDRESNGVMPLTLEFKQVTFAALTTVEVQVRAPKKSRSNESTNGGKKASSAVAPVPTSLLKQAVNAGIL